MVKPPKYDSGTNSGRNPVFSMMKTHTVVSVKKKENTGFCWGVNGIAVVQVLEDSSPCLTETVWIHSGWGRGVGGDFHDLLPEH